MFFTRPGPPLTAPGDGAKSVRDVLLSGDGRDVAAARAYAAAAAAYEADPGQRILGRSAAPAQL